MNGQEIISTQRRRRQFRVRNRLKSGRPRLSVFRSGRHIYAQVIDDSTGRTLAAASSLEVSLRGKLGSGGNTAWRGGNGIIDNRRPAIGIGTVGDGSLGIADCSGTNSWSGGDSDNSTTLGQTVGTAACTARRTRSCYCSCLRTITTNSW